MLMNSLLRRLAPLMRTRLPSFALVAAICSALVYVEAARAADEAASSNGSVKIRLLILSGANNHDWKRTTPVLQNMYEAAGHFAVDVTEKVPELTADDFAKYDVLVCNYTTFPNVAGHRWLAETEKAFLKYIADGHGLVLFHAASTAWADWPEFGELIGITWVKASGHGDYHAFAVKIVDPEHPIMAGLKDFQHLPDELYHRQELHKTGKVLAAAHSDEAKHGTGNDEPMVVVTEYGKGRVFYTALGHDAKAMAGVAFQTLMLRGTEWAATGKVTTPIPKNWPAAENARP